MTALPNRGPYDPMYENLPALPDGMVHNQFPWDAKFTYDSDFYDTLGRSLVEQREVFTKSRSEEEQITMIKQIFEETPTSPGGEGREWSICLEAAIKGSAAVMRYLVREKGLKVENAPEGAGALNAELFIACVNGFVDVVEVLVDEAGVDVNAVDEEEAVTPLIKALQGGHMETVEWLLQRGADWKMHEENVFSYAVMSGKVEVLKRILDLAMQDEPEKPSKTWIQGRMICQAAALGNDELMKYIIEKGDYPLAATATDDQRLLALDALLFSLKNEETDPACFQLALERALLKDPSTGSFIQVPSSIEEKAIETLKISIGICCNRGKLDDLRSILTILFFTTSVTYPSPDFSTILRYALRRCYDPLSQPCASLLLDTYNADPNSSADGDEFFGTPLNLGAIGRNNPAWTKFWLEHGADIHRAFGTYCTGPTALANAIRFQEEANVRLLLEWGGPVDFLGDVEGEREVKVLVRGGTGEGFFEDGRVEVRGCEEEVQGEVVEMVLGLGEGVGREWVERIEMRRDMREDGTGRPVKER